MRSGRWWRVSFLYNNVAVFTVAAVVSVTGWMFGGTRGDLLIPVMPWLFALMVEVIVCFPQCQRGETIYEARARVWKEMKRSPLVWLACAFLLLQIIPFFNTGLCAECDAALIAQGFSPRPPFPFLPFCVDRLNHFCVVLWFMAALPAAIAVHHCLTRRGKRLVIELIVWNGVALAILGFAQSATSAPGPFWNGPANGRMIGYFFSTFGYPNMAGSYFTTLFGLAVALWRDQYERIWREENDGSQSGLSGKTAKKRGRFWRRHYFLMPAILLFFAALNTLSRAAIILVTVTAIIYFAHTLVIILSRMRRSRRVWIGVWSMVVFGLIVFFAAISMPEKMRREVHTLGTAEMLDRVTGREQYHVQVATSIWGDHPIFGVGGWGYAHFCLSKMEQLGIPVKSVQTVGGINVHNDHLQFLMEHGIVGFGLLVAMVYFLLRPVLSQWRITVQDLRFKKGRNLPPRPIQIFALPGPVFFILISALATVIHAFGDCPFRSCAILELFFVSLAALPGFMPRQGDEQHHHHHHHH